jgi:hypothetical protein
MSRYYVVYRKDTGLIHKHIIGSLNPCDWDPATQGYIELSATDAVVDRVVNLATLELVDKAEIAYRLEGLNPVSDSTTEFIIKDVPHGTVCEGDKIDDGELCITFDAPGVYTFELTNPLHSPTSITVTVREP